MIKFKLLLVFINILIDFIRKYDIIYLKEI